MLLLFLWIYKCFVLKQNILIKIFIIYTVILYTIYIHIPHPLLCTYQTTIKTKSINKMHNNHVNIYISERSRYMKFEIYVQYTYMINF